MNPFGRRRHVSHLIAPLHNPIIVCSLKAARSKKPYEPKPSSSLSVSWERARHAAPNGWRNKLRVP